MATWWKSITAWAFIRATATSPRLRCAWVRRLKKGPRSDDWVPPAAVPGRMSITKSGTMTWCGTPATSLRQAGMFSSKNKDIAHANANANEASPPVQPKRVGRSGTAPSIVSTDLTVTGTLNTSGDMQVDGIVEGDVRSVGLVIGERAEIHG